MYDDLISALWFVLRGNSTSGIIGSCWLYTDLL